MSFWQKLMKGVLPKETATNMEAESRRWLFQCNKCQEEHSIWDVGGIRWGAAGNPTRYLTCPNCGTGGMYTLSYKKVKSDEL